MKSLWWRQIQGILRLEVRKNVFSMRALPLYLLAVIPAAVIWGWEAANLLLPPALKRFSVIFHLHSLYPVPLARGAFEVVGSPVPAWMAVTGAIGFTLLVLYIAGRKVSRMDLAYGGE